ncbi:formylglycine-generating enzyme family protein, partial [Bacteroidota bacterium]
QFKSLYPMFSLEIDNILDNSLSSVVFTSDSIYRVSFQDRIIADILHIANFKRGDKITVIFKNISQDTIDISNLVPLGISEKHIHITASGPWSLTRAKLFRPNKVPVGIMLPDNIWELGYSSIKLIDDYSVCSIARRVSYENAKRRRWRTILYPGGKVVYDLYSDVFSGEWQNGIRMMFQDRFLYDLDEFPNNLFEREDLQWIRDKYTIILVMAWDKRFYDRDANRNNYKQLFDEGEKYFGGYDVFGIWPTWPTLGLDQRNQWDLYSDLPGGLQSLHELSSYCKKNDSRFYIAYNPWDQSTREEDPYEGLYKLIKETDADGVVIDTRGKSSLLLQNTADKAKPGVVMYSEGMAVVKDMPGIISGRAHNAIFMQPVLNLNKLIKPEFAIFRVIDVAEASFKREVTVSFFNGYGNELNMYRPGRPDYMDDDYTYMGKLTKILRDNSSVFLNKNWTPLIPTLTDNIWVNKWFDKNKTVYTIFSLLPEGFSDPLFEIDTKLNSHFIDIYNHTEIIPDTINGKLYISPCVAGFSKHWLGTRKEGNVGCIVEFGKNLNVILEQDSIIFTSSKGTSIHLWMGDPSFQNKSKKLQINNNNNKVSLSDLNSNNETKIVLQLFENKNLIDERIINIDPGLPRFISKSVKTESVSSVPLGMVEVPSGKFFFFITHSDNFIPYPEYKVSVEKKLDKFYIDKYPVTNRQFKQFIDESSYEPQDVNNFLKHWVNGSYLPDQEYHPVVYVSIEDARAYADWAKKRLPTQIEWQYAAQAGDSSMIYPWGAELDSTKCNYGIGETTPINQFPEGENELGIADLIGNVWQLTNDIYDNGSYRYIIIKGGSFFKPTSSWWYVQGGPKPLNYAQALLIVSAGFERNATVGFRCVKDAN